MEKKETICPYCKKVLQNNEDEFYYCDNLKCYFAFVPRLLEFYNLPKTKMEAVREKITEGVQSIKKEVEVAKKEIKKVTDQIPQQEEEYDWGQNGFNVDMNNIGI